jgi:Thiol:disulfide interchange protein DsbD, N-terminal
VKLKTTSKKSLLRQPWPKNNYLPSAPGLRKIENSERNPESVLNFAAKLATLLMVVAALSAAQEDFAKKSPTVTMSPATLATISRGSVGTVSLNFHVASGFHINSNKPAAEYLIPTALKLDVPTDISVGTVYPAGEEMSFAFAPNEKLSVYSGDFTLSVSVRPLASVLPSKYEFHGNLRYQACDNAACYPPKNLPVQFEVKVVKAPAPKKKNPPQSPRG